MEPRGRTQERKVRVCFKSKRQKLLTQEDLLCKLVSKRFKITRKTKIEIELDLGPRLFKTGFDSRFHDEIRVDPSPQE